MHRSQWRFSRALRSGSLLATVFALVGAAGCAVLGAGNPKQFFFSWLVSFLFFLSLALGALFFVLIQYAVQGGWGIVLRQPIYEKDRLDPVDPAATLPASSGGRRAAGSFSSSFVSANH